MFEQKEYEIILEAATPIAHHAETLGNSAIHMRRKVRLPNGRWANVPIITGDTMRHGLREAASYALLDAAGMLGKGRLSEEALRLLFAGGMVTGRGDASTVKLDEYREMVQLVPPLSLLGGCASNRVISGKVFAEDAVLMCDETTHLLPEWTVEWAREHRGGFDTHREHVEEVQRVRMDPTLDPEKRLLLSDEARDRVEKRLLASETAHADDDALARESSKSSMLPRRHETVVSGSLFFWRVSATVHSELEADTLDTMICAFLANARVGGKRRTGHGRIRALVGNEVPILRPREAASAVDFAALGAARGQVFRKHVAERAEKLRDFLARVDA